jgi:succinate dehydrogenase/fumarate reductase flavoprotein subunit
MQRYGSVFRIEKYLQEGCDKMDEVWEMYKQVGIKDRSLSWNTDLIEAFELENLLL